MDSSSKSNSETFDAPPSQVNGIVEEEASNEFSNFGTSQNQANDVVRKEDVNVNPKEENQKDAQNVEKEVRSNENLENEDSSKFAGEDVPQNGSDVVESEDTQINVEEEHQKKAVETEDISKDQVNEDVNIIVREESPKASTEDECQMNGEAVNEISNEIVEDKNQEVAAKTEGTSNAPKINVLHENVRNHIRSYVEQQGYTDVTIDVEVGSNLGDNFMGFIGKLTVTGVKDADKEIFNWIVKTAPNIEAYRAMLDISNAYEREVYMYGHVLKIFQDFQRSKRVLEPFDQHPIYILSYLENMNESIVMKDMKSVGYVMRPRHETLDVNHVKLVMKAYAKLHATSYALKDQKPDIFKQIAENTQDILASTMLTDQVIQAQAPMLNLSLAALDSTKDVKMYKILKKFIDNYPSILTELLKDTNDRSVIGHGDSWVNNMLWKYDVPNSNIPSKVCLVDWQLARYGSPACDLSYFIFTCTSKDFRDKYYDDMIKLYYNTLCAHMNELGSDPQKILPFEELQEELKKYSLVGLLLTIMVLCIITRDTSEIPEWREDNKTQEEMQEQWNKTSKNVDVYYKRVRGVIVDYYEKGYFRTIM